MIERLEEEMVGLGRVGKCLIVGFFWKDRILNGIRDIRPCLDNFGESFV